MDILTAFTILTILAWVCGKFENYHDPDDINDYGGFSRD